MPKLYIKTYGCQMNERDSEQVARMFVQKGYTMTDREDEADVILFNSCSIREQAEQKALGKMGLLAKQQRHRPHVVYGMMGCMAQSKKEELFKELPRLDLVVGTQKYHRTWTAFCARARNAAWTSCKPPFPARMCAMWRKRRTPRTASGTT